MAYLRKTLHPDQEIVVTLAPDADREELVKRLALNGVRLKVLERGQRGYKIGVMAPAGLTPERRDRSPFKKCAAERCLALTRSVGGEIVVTLREGAHANAVLDWLASEGLAFQMNAARSNQCVIGVRAVDEFLILREELRV